MLMFYAFSDVYLHFIIGLLLCRQNKTKLTVSNFSEVFIGQGSYLIVIRECWIQIILCFIIQHANSFYIIVNF